MRKTLLAAALSAIAFTTAQAVTCDDYKNADGTPIVDDIDVQYPDGKIRIISTASVGVSFDDIDAVNDARDEAKMEAKKAIASFLSEGIKSDNTVNRAVREDKTLQGKAGQAKRTEVATLVKNLAGNTSALLRGVVPLGSCYTPGLLMRVTVGVKTETITAAGNLANSIAQPVAPQAPAASTNGGASAPSEGAAAAGDPLRQTPGFANSHRLNNF